MRLLLFLCVLPFLPITSAVICLSSNLLIIAQEGFCTHRLNCSVYEMEFHIKDLTLNIAILGVGAILREATIRVSICRSVCPSVPPFAWNDSSSAGRIFIKLYIEVGGGGVGGWVGGSAICREIKSLVRNRKNIRHFTWRPTHTQYCGGN